ncbi:hypothetical protein ACROYT_G029018 [Oculina patagonica]
MAYISGNIGTFFKPTDISDVSTSLLSTCAGDGSLAASFIKTSSIHIGIVKSLSGPGSSIEGKSYQSVNQRGQVCFGSMASLKAAYSTPVTQSLACFFCSRLKRGRFTAKL